MHKAYITTDGRNSMLHSFLTHPRKVLFLALLSFSFVSMLISCKTTKPPSDESQTKSINFFFPEEFVGTWKGEVKGTADKNQVNIKIVITRSSATIYTIKKTGDVVWDKVSTLEYWLGWDTEKYYFLACKNIGDGYHAVQSFKVENSGKILDWQLHRSDSCSLGTPVAYAEKLKKVE